MNDSKDRDVQKTSGRDCVDDFSLSERILYMGERGTDTSAVFVCLLC